MIDIQECPSTTLTAADFRFAVGNSNQTGSWAAARHRPALSCVAEQVNGADRVELVWADHAITGVWLQVTVLPSGNTGSAAADTFCFVNQRVGQRARQYASELDRRNCRAYQQHRRVRSGGDQLAV